jgi:hypothetical protein
LLERVPLARSHLVGQLIVDISIVGLITYVNRAAIRAADLEVALRLEAAHTFSAPNS